MHIRGNKLFTSGWIRRRGVPRSTIWLGIATQAPGLLGTIEDSTQYGTGTYAQHHGRAKTAITYLSVPRDNNGTGDLRVYDVRNPAQPLLVRTTQSGDLDLNAVTPHNPVVMGNKLYISWYQAGVQVFDISTRQIREGSGNTIHSLRHSLRRNQEDTGDQGRRPART